MIKEILELKGNREYLKSTLDLCVLDDGGNYKEYDWIITINPFGYRCGYVSIPNYHNLTVEFTKNIGNYEFFDDIQVHGGITFCNLGSLVADKFITTNSPEEFWLGFDCCHGFDEPDYELSKKLWDDENIIKHIEELQNIKKQSIKARTEMYKEFNLPISEECKIRKKDYVKEQCEGLIDQLIERDKIIYDR